MAELQRDGVDAAEVSAAGPQAVRAQYSLAGLFGLTVACGAYLSTLSVLARLPWSTEHLPWEAVFALCLAWLLLTAFYVRRDARVIAVLHCLGLALGGVCLPFVFAAYGEHINGAYPRTSPGQIMLDVAALSCAAGTLLSLPAFLWSLLVLGVRSIYRSRAKRQ